MATREKYLTCLKYMNKTMKADNAEGHQWSYCNVTSKKAKGFEQARKQGKYKLNCVDGCQWGLLLTGEVPSSALAWYLSNGKIVWCSSNAKANCKKYFEIIHIGGKKTVKQLVKNGTLIPGDIIGYMNMAHTNCYYGNNKSFDSGHAFCSGSGEGARSKKWLGSLRYGSSKVSYILRLKSRIRYRVQCGAFSDLGTMAQVEAALKNAGFATTRVSEDGYVKLQAGLFDNKDNATKLMNRIKEKDFAAIVKEVE